MFSSVGKPKTPIPDLSKVPIRKPAFAHPDKVLCPSKEKLQDGFPGVEKVIFQVTHGLTGCQLIKDAESTEALLIFSVVSAAFLVSACSSWHRY